MTLSCATIPGKSGPESDGMKGSFAFPKAPATKEPHHQIV